MFSKYCLLWEKTEFLELQGFLRSKTSTELRVDVTNKNVTNFVDLTKFFNSQLPAALKATFLRPLRKEGVPTVNLSVAKSLR